MKEFLIQEIAFVLSFAIKSLPLLFVFLIFYTFNLMRHGETKKKKGIGYILFPVAIILLFLSFFAVRTIKEKGKEIERNQSLEEKAKFQSFIQNGRLENEIYNINLIKKPIYYFLKSYLTFRK